MRHRFTGNLEGVVLLEFIHELTKLCKVLIYNNAVIFKTGIQVNTIVFAMCDQLCFPSRVKCCLCNSAGMGQSHASTMYDSQYLISMLNPNKLRLKKEQNATT